MASSSEVKHVLVIGAGIIGLQSAVRLLETGHKVSVIAKHMPGEESIEYTSPWAGAHWRPHGQAEDKEQCKWDVQSYWQWMKLYEDEFMQGVPEYRRAGVLPVRSRLLWDSKGHPELQPTGDPANIWFAREVQQYATTTKPPAGCAAAAQFTTVAVNVPRFLQWLVRRVEQLGGSMVRAELPLDGGLEAALVAAAKAAGIEHDGGVMFVNATGLAARKLCGDDRVYPARGQTVLVKGVSNGCVTRQGDSYISYCIPRPGSGTTIIGGSKEANRWDAGEDKQTTEDILRRARDICPELLTPYKDKQTGKFQVLKVNVGLRPMRTGGARMEREALASGKVVVHAYGHGGAGFQNSYGAAAEVVELCRASIPNRTKL